MSNTIIGLSIDMAALAGFWAEDPAARSVTPHAHWEPEEIH